MKQRSTTAEIMDDPDVAREVWEKFHRDLWRLHRLLGTGRALIRALRRDPHPAASVLDIGCGDGALLAEIRRKLGVRVVGIDLRGPARPRPGIPILEADATRDPLPEADAAIAVWVAHHLTEAQLVALIRNVARTSRRLILVDLVRHWLPLALFRVFLHPLVDGAAADDGCQSVRRAFTPAELRALVEQAIAGSTARFRHSVSPWRASQWIDITWP